MEKRTLRLSPIRLLIGCMGPFLMGTWGCGPSTPFPMVKITGTVLYDDGSPIPGDRVTVTFVPQVLPADPKTHPRSAFAVLDNETGEIGVVTTVKYGDGLIRGKHKVYVNSVDKQNYQLPVVPSSYTNVKETPIEIDTADSLIEIKIPRPNSGHRDP